jgi:hypothetical protein
VKDNLSDSSVTLPDSCVAVTDAEGCDVLELDAEIVGKGEDQFQYSADCNIPWVRQACPYRCMACMEPEETTEPPPTPEKKGYCKGVEAVDRESCNELKDDGDCQYNWIYEACPLSCCNYTAPVPVTPQTCDDGIEDPEGCNTFLDDEVALEEFCLCEDVRNKCRFACGTCECPRDADYCQYICEDCGCDEATAAACPRKCGACSISTLAPATEEPTTAEAEPETTAAPEQNEPETTPEPNVPNCSNDEDALHDLAIRAGLEAELKGQKARCVFLQQSAYSPYCENSAVKKACPKTCGFDGCA